MYNSLIGEITYKAPGNIYLLLNGIEWDIVVSTSALDKLPAPGQQAKVYTYLYHKEDRMKMYGFHSVKERNLFLDLVKVESIGPALALKILSGIKVEDFITALDNEDIAALTVVPGLGKKTAQKIIFKLRGKLTSPGKTENPVYEDITTALVGMGFENKKSREAVASASKEIDKTALSSEELEKELIKISIKKLSGRK